MDPRVDELLQHAPWLRALARRLVVDAQAADDAVQSTWLAALAANVPAGSEGRRWLAVVLRRFANQGRRAESRRAAREALVARPEAQAPDLPETLELQRRLLAAVEALPEPYRTTIYRRYYDGLAPRRIATLDGVPVKTVKTRLLRGLARLRSELDSAHGGKREAWLAAFLPWLRSSPVPTILGASIMSVSHKAVFGAVAVLVLVFSVWRLRSSSVDATEPETAAVDSALLPAPAHLANPSTEASEHAAGSARVPEVPTPALEAAIASPLVHGRVLDIEEHPVAGLGLWTFPYRHRFGAGLELRPPEAWSDATGAFALPMPPDEAVVVVAQGPSHVTVLAGDLWGATPTARPIVVVAPRVALAGVVRDPDGEPVAGARLWVDIDPELRLGMNAVVDTAFEFTSATVRSDTEGRFALPDAAGGVGRLKAWASGFEELVLPVPEGSRADLELTLVRAAEKWLELRGRVVDPNGVGAEGAQVSLGDSLARSGANGAFTLPLREQDAEPSFEMDENGLARRIGAEVLAVHAGHLPGRLSLPDLDLLRALVARGEHVTILLGGEPLVIRGRVRDARGRPIAGARVRPRVGTEINHLAGGEGDGTWATTVEALVAGDSDERGALTAADGSFELGGLLERSYDLLAVHVPTARSALVREVAAGTEEVELELELEESCRPVRGRVLALDGKPLAGVLVFPHHESDESGAFVSGERRVTDSEGRFSFAALSARVTGFQVNHQEFLCLDLPWRERAPEVEARLSRRCRIRVELGEASGDEYCVLDEAGNRLPQTISEGSSWWEGDTIPLRGARSSQASVPENARTAVLRRQGREVARRALEPDPARLVVVRF